MMNLNIGTRSTLILLLAFAILSAFPAQGGGVCQDCWQYNGGLFSTTEAICYPTGTGPTGSSWTRMTVRDCSCGTVTKPSGDTVCTPQSSYCNADGTCGDSGSTGGDPFNDDGGTSPIVVDLGRGGFELTGPDDPVQFDIDADGMVETITWTSAAGDDAFLVLDRDGDGSIGDGRELFGTATPQPPSDEPNGFLALAVYDGAGEGGDGDGWITPADAVWASLRLWSDLDHDGVAQALELAPLDGFGIAGIELAYVDARRRDRHGNLLRWAARVRFAHGQRLAASDVIFLAP